MRIAALARLQEKAPRGATCPGRRGKVFFVSSPYVRVLQSARFGYRQTEMKHNKFKTKVDNSSQPGPKPKTTTRILVLQPARFGYTEANGNEAHQIQNKQVANSSLDQTTRLQRRVSCGVVLMASTMLHEKCCNTVLQIGAPLPHSNPETRFRRERGTRICMNACSTYPMYSVEGIHCLRDIHSYLDHYRKSSTVIIPRRFDQ